MSDIQRQQWIFERTIEIFKVVVTTSLGMIAAIGVWSQGSPNRAHLGAAICSVLSFFSCLILLTLFGFNLHQTELYSLPNRVRLPMVFTSLFVMVSQATAVALLLVGFFI